MLGLRHAFDADHIAAVSTLVMRTDGIQQSLRHGALWGIGHLCTLTFLGLLLLRYRLPLTDRLAALFEGLVGLMLLLLGLHVLTQNRPHAAEEGHYPAHASLPGRPTRLRSFLVGAVHGLAGSGALMLLVLSTVPSMGLGLAYILVFGIGSGLGMLLFSGVLALPFALWVDNGKLHRRLTLMAGGASILLGIFILFEFFVTA